MNLTAFLICFGVYFKSYLSIKSLCTGKISAEQQEGNSRALRASVLCPSAPAGKVLLPWISLVDDPGSTVKFIVPVEEIGRYVLDQASPARLDLRQVVQPRDRTFSRRLLTNKGLCGLNILRIIDQSSQTIPAANSVMIKTKRKPLSTFLQIVLHLKEYDKTTSVSALLHLKTC